MWIDTQVGSETGSHPCAGFNHFYGTFLPGFLKSIISIWLALSLYLVCLSNLPCVHTCSLLTSKESATLSESAHVSVHTYSLSSNKHLTCFTTFSQWKLISTQQTGPGPYYWPLVV